jgi:RNAse (barnase) inhibitor barstar
MRNCSSSSDMSDSYNNLKAAWDCLMEATEHVSPQGLCVAVTVVLE